MKNIMKILKLIAAGTIIGAAVSAVICIYKFCAHHIIHFSEKCYHLLRENLWFIPVVLAVLFLISLALSKVYRRFENLKGGGIPNAVLSAQGKMRLSPIRDGIGAFVMSLLSFLLGVPLGNEGPCVQIGASIASVKTRDEQMNKAYVSAGACAGFAAATGSPLAAIAFLFNEIDCRAKWTYILCVSFASLICAAVSYFLCPIFGVEFALLPELKLAEFSLSYIWVAVVVGIVFALFSVAFLGIYKVLRAFYNKTAVKLPAQYKIFFVLSLTLVLGIVSADFVSTGHGLSVKLLSASMPLIWLCAILLVRTFLTLSANTNSLSGGTFVPLIAIGIVLASALFLCLSGILSAEYYSLVLMLSVAATVSGMMKMPAVSFFFVIETFHCPQYIPFIIVTIAISYLLPAVLKINSINEEVIESKK